jgi:hypothetical protein
MARRLRGTVVAPRSTVRDERSEKAMNNTLKTTILLGAMTAVTIGAALAIAAVTNFGGLLVL